MAYQESFDSSTQQDSLFSTRQPYQTPYGQASRGGDVNFPSLAQSFQADEQDLYIGKGQARGGGNTRAVPNVTQEDFSSILEEEIIGSGKLNGKSNNGLDDEDDSFPSMVNAAVKSSVPNSAVQRAKLPLNPILDVSMDSIVVWSGKKPQSEPNLIDQSTDLEDSISPSAQAGQKLPFRAVTGVGRGRENKSTAGARGGRPGKPKAKESNQPLSLREQEAVIDESKKEIFGLKLKLHFFEERMKELNPASINAALQENIELKVEFQTMKAELKRYRKLLLESEKIIESLSQANGGQESNNRRESELERMLREEREGRARDKLELERRIEELMRAAKKGKSLATVNEDSEAQIAQLNEQVLQKQEEYDELLDDQQGLQNENLELKDRLAVAQEDAADLQSQLEGGNETRGDKTGNTTSGATRKTEELITENTSLRAQLSAQVIMLKNGNNEKESLQDEVELLKSENETLENELEQAERARERDSSVAGESVTEAEKDALVEDIADLRDQIAATNLLLEQKETEIEELLTDLDNRDEDHRIDLTNKGIEVEDEWRAEVEAARNKRDEISENLRERDEEIKELVDRLDEFVDLRQQDAATIEELNALVVDKEIEIAASNEEIDALNHDVKTLGDEVNEVTGELEVKITELQRAEAELGEVDQEFEQKEKLHESAIASLKEKFYATNARHSELTIQHSTSVTECNFLRSQLEEMALAAGVAGEEFKITKKNLESEFAEIEEKYRVEMDERKLDQNEWTRQRRGEDEKWSRIYDEKDLAIQHATKDLAQSKELLSIREADLQKLQNALNSLQSDSNDNTNHRSTLQLESDRLKRDLIRAEEEVERLADENDVKDGTLREAELNVATLRSEVRDIRDQLSNANQTRLDLSDKLDKTATEKRNLQNDLISARDRAAVAEDQLATGNKALSRTEGQSLVQINERNALLLTVYQHLDKVAPANERTPRKSNDPKPFTNFPLFSDSLLLRCKNIDQIQLTFSKRVKELESKLVDQFNNLKKEIDLKGRHIDRFEIAVKAAAESQREWRQKVSAKQSELDAAKVQLNTIQSQLNRLKAQVSNSESATDAATNLELNTLNTKMVAAERALSSARTKLLEAHERAEENQAKVNRVTAKWVMEEEKWHARIKELELRCKAAEERTKRERQGAKERLIAMEEDTKRLLREKSEAERRNHILGEQILNSNKINSQAAAIVAANK